MHMLFTLFYRQFGVRRLQQLMDPRLVTLDAVPRGTMIHYLTHDKQNPDLDTAKSYFTSFANKKILVDFVTQTKVLVDNPRPINLMVRAITQPFFKNNRVYRYMPEAYATITDPETLLVINYNYLYTCNRYANTPYEVYNRWLNSEYTRWNNIANIASKCDRQHFVYVNVPKYLPSWSMLNQFSKKISTSMLKVFNTPDHLFLLEFWKWLNPELRNTTIFRDITEDQIGKINIVFTSGNGRSAVLNMGYLYSWITGAKNLTEFNQITQLEFDRLQKLFLKFTMTLNSTVEEAAVEVPEEPEVVQNQDSDFETEETNSEEAPMSFNMTQKTPVSNSSNVLLPNATDAELDSASSEDEDLDTKLKNIDSELDTLEAISKQNLKNRGLKLDEDGDTYSVPEEVVEKSLEEINAEVYKDPSHLEALIRTLDRQAEYGLISAADYKKLLAEAKAYPEKPDPYGNKRNIAQTIDIKLEDYTLKPEDTTMVITPIVKDRSMCESSLNVFDADYINKMMPRHMVSMVASLQKAGVVVRKHEMELDTSVLGTYENHSIELKPVDGQPSSLRFRFPKVDEDGTMVSNTNKYSLRKQRVDTPLRKISPTEVALSSYYGKTFVALSPKKANSSSAWIIKKIEEAMIIENPNLSKIAPADVYDNHFKAPYIYGVLAQSFKGFKAGNLNLMFDCNLRNTLVENETLTKLEKNGSVVVGLTDKKNPVLLDSSNNFLIYSNGESELVGNIYKVLNLSALSAPVDFAEVRLFSKQVPVGVMLAYFLGFNNLIKFLNVKYRIVEGRKQKEMSDDQFAVTFNDVSYIFSRNNKVASIILGGFQDFAKMTKQYPVSEFNKKDVYLNLLESKGLGSLYIREMELIDQMFVDPVTADVLTKMKEPTTFRGLLVRASELLTTYEYPDTQDFTVMRVRGYERFAGALYKELIVSLRQYRNKNLAGKSKIDMSPYAVGNSIAKDAAIKIVEDINPIQNLKEAEIVTYVGEGGRSKDAFSKPARSYHKTDMGVVSEATVDSSDVSINAYLSANPNFDDMLGTIKTDKVINPTTLLSTSALLSPGATHDDPRRVETVYIV